MTQDRAPRREKAQRSASRSASTARGATATTGPKASPRRPDQGAARRRDGDRRPGPGPGHRRQCRDRRFHPAPLRRDADLYAGGGGRRFRHGTLPTSSAATIISTTPSASWRSSGDGLAGPDIRPCPADPWVRRRQADNVTARSASMPIATSSVSCPRRCSTICSVSAGAMATTRSSAAIRRSNGSTSTMSAKARRGSTSRSSKI